MFNSMYFRLLYFLKPYKLPVVAVCFAIAAAAGFTMVQPKLLQWAVDTGLKPSVSTRLSTDLTSSATTLSVKDPDRLVLGQVLLIRGEKLRVTAVESEKLTVERGVNGTTAKTHGA